LNPKRTMARPASTPAQAELFAEPQRLGIPGLRYQTNFLTAAEELALLDIIRRLELREAQYRQWRAHRRTISFGGKYDFTANKLLPAEPIPPFLFALRARVAAWSGVDASQLNHALIAEYRAGTQLGWHRDVPNFESVVGISLAGAARLRFRPYPPRIGQRKAAFAIELAPRSIYSMQDSARWDWQHALSPTKTLRYSITMRTLAQGHTRRSR
jgi:alkylated DNA repair dioxygenase AlkB